MTTTGSYFDHYIFNQTQTLSRDLLLIVAGSLFIALFAQISIPMIPVPLTGQSFAILLIGALMGGKRAFLTTSLYVFEGAVGLPVFANASFGLPVLFGPTGGYLFGFIFAATAMGYLSEKFLFDRKLSTALLIFSVGHFIIFSFGMIHLMKFMTLTQAYSVGVSPFILGLVIKTFLAAGCTKTLWNLRKTNS